MNDTRFHRGGEQISSISFPPLDYLGLSLSVCAWVRILRARNSYLDFRGTNQTFLKETGL